MSRPTCYSSVQEVLADKKLIVTMPPDTVLGNPRALEQFRNQPSTSA